MTWDDTILSAFIDKKTYFQEGDGRVFAYISYNKLIIQNEGDVASIVIIKYDTELEEELRLLLLKTKRVLNTYFYDVLVDIIISYGNI